MSLVLFGNPYFIAPAFTSSESFKKRHEIKSIFSFQLGRKEKTILHTMLHVALY